MDRNENILKSMFKFCDSYPTQELNNDLKDWDFSWPILQQLNSGTITYEGITEFGWEMLEELFIYLQESYNFPENF